MLRGKYVTPEIVSVEMDMDCIIATSDKVGVDNNPEVFDADTKSRGFKIVDFSSSNSCCDE